MLLRNFILYGSPRQSRETKTPMVHRQPFCTDFAITVKSYKSTFCALIKCLLHLNPKDFTKLSTHF